MQVHQLSSAFFTTLKFTTEKVSPQDTTVFMCALMHESKQILKTTEDNADSIITVCTSVCFNHS